MNLEDKELKDLFQLADQIGNKRYHRLTNQDLEDYYKYNNWRYVDGNSDHGTTQESRDWVKDNSESRCPICEEKYADSGGRTIDHKLPRAQYPWLSMDFKNLWVICHTCNQEKSEMNWYEYELYMLNQHPDRYPNVKFMRPIHLLKTLKE